MLETLGLSVEMAVVLAVLAFTVFLFVSEIVRVDVAAILVMVLLGGLAALPGLETLVEDQGVSVLYITHDLATAYYAADRIAIMLRGWIVESGPVEEVLGNPLHPYSKNLKESVPEADPDKLLSGVVTHLSTSCPALEMQPIELRGVNDDYDTIAVMLACGKHPGTGRGEFSILRGIDG